MILWPQLSSAEHEEAWKAICRLLNERREWFRSRWAHALCLFCSPVVYDTFGDESVDI